MLDLVKVQLRGFKSLRGVKKVKTAVKNKTAALASNWDVEIIG